MPSPSSALSPILAFFLSLTKFAGEKKVPVLEWLLAWTTVVVFGLRYIVDYARLRWKLYKLAKSAVKSVVSEGAPGTIISKTQPQQTGEHSSSSLCDCLSLCPLAHTRKEFLVGIEERWERFRRVLFLASSILDHDGDASIESDSEPPVSQIAERTKEWTDNDWIQIFRSNLDVRREASYLMFALSGGTQDLSPSSCPTKESIVLSKIRMLWPRFLEFPQWVVKEIGDDGASSNKDRNSEDSNPVYDISLIVPMYKERIVDIAYTLNQAFGNCIGDPKKIQVVIAHAQSSPSDGFASNKNGTKGSGYSLLRQQLIAQQQQQQQQQNNRTQAPKDQQNRKDESESVWGELKVVTIPFGEGGGRGRTLNTGAGQATAPILTFLHADTMMPLGWDEKVRGALAVSSGERGEANAVCEGSFPHACAFTMAIDDEKVCTKHTSKISPSASSSSPKSSQSKSKTPGLIGAEWLGVLRCYCGLPYGDSVLSFSRLVFDYMGGYPDQPLMEDYEVMDWLRLRSVLLSTMHKMTKGSTKGKVNPVGVHRGEHLVLLKDRAKCSPRRWQKYGVAYTSLINAACIFRYRSKATTEELFDFYYHCNSSSSSSSSNSASKGNQSK